MIYVVTAVHNRYKITEKFVDCLLKQSYKDIKLILVDDGSIDGTSDMVKSKMPDAVIIKGNGNLWWGGSLHKAYLWLCENTDENDESYVMFANDDTEFGNTYIENAIGILRENRKILLTGYGIGKQTKKQVDGAIDFDFKRLSKVLSKTGKGNCASTRSLFFKLSDFKEIGGFKPKRLPHYGSDYEWTLRACLKHGYTVVCDDKLSYFANEDTTGDNFYYTLTRKKLFSKRSASNPVYKLNFIFTALPKKYIFAALWYQVIRYFKKADKILEILKR